MRGVVIFRIADGEISSARFYLEPVEAAGGDVNAAVRRVLGRPLEDGNPEAGTPASRLEEPDAAESKERETS